MCIRDRDCMYQRNSRCYELVVGPPGEPVIIETSEEANWVNRYTIPFVLFVKVFLSSTSDLEVHVR